MPTDPKPTDPPPRIPRPPSKEDVDQISREQSLITDEWAGPDQPAPDPAKPAQE